MSISNRGGGAAASPPYPNNNNPYDTYSHNNGEENVEDYMQDYREKRKLLVRWSQYFPTENVREFDVSFYSVLDCDIAERFQTSMHHGLL